ncbi:MAG: triphosphoribosyl-dephospho-CoA synthase CitG [Treponema sp.]|nr:triphosphoribosyl-dephospho-CoA synthase CitG [Treponema sp.]
MASIPELEGSVPVSLEEILEERENRANHQRQLLEKYTCTLLCLTLNIPGPCKTFPLARRAFLEGLNTVRLILEAEGLQIVHEELTENPAGYTGYIITQSAPEKAKELSTFIEETHPMGRLFDIDVISASMQKISRDKERCCLLCPKLAFECSRNRTHDINDLQRAIINLMKVFFRKHLGKLITKAAMKALMAEVAVTPKPGLVDRVNNGSHRDMDFYTFIDSTAAVLSYFNECASMGFDNDRELPALFEALRPGGKVAEVLMKQATNGANTHRGVIFSFGIVSAAYGVLYKKSDIVKPEEILDTCKVMTSSLLEDFSKAESNTHGEAIYSRHGIQGIRGEAATGFPSVLEHSYPIFQKMLIEGHSYNDAGIAAFLSLLACVDDTNIIHRSCLSTLRCIQKETADFLNRNPSPADMLNRAAELDRQFIAENISPGGCADLLALTFFLHELVN